MSKDLKRVRAGQLKIISADLVTVGRFKPEAYGGAVHLHVVDSGGGVVIVLVPDAQIPEMASAAMSLAQTARDRRPDPSLEVVPMERSRAIPADGLSVLDEETGGAPVGHAVLRIKVGEVPFDFSAPRDVWRQMLASLSEEGAPQSKPS